MRLLIVTHAPLSTEFGASQIAINLSRDLRAQGHDVILWSPQPLPAGTRWWQTLQTMRRKLDEFLKTQDSFDVIDCPAPLVTRRTGRSALVVVRSTQPDILYLFNDFGRQAWRNLHALARLPFDGAYTLYHLWLVLRGWQRAAQIMCLGSLELLWMQRWFPFWRGKLTSYFIAPSKEEQEALAVVRRARLRHTTERLRFLWIGRWTAHKGTDVLISFIRRWAEQRPQDTFTIAGCGPDAERDCPAELLRAGIIKIIPSFERSELYELLAQHDAGLFTSKIEGWGLVLNEMLESGMPVFATQVGGAEDLHPFFKTLFPFPPPIEIDHIIQEPEISSVYYIRFSWRCLAQSYAALTEEIFSGERRLIGG